MARIGMKEGQPFDPQQNADVRIAKSQLDWAKMDLDRSTKLIENGDISRSVYDQTVINHQMAQARYQAALDQVQQQLALIDQQRASVSLAKKGETDTVVRSPINGSVKEKHAGRGGYLPVNGKIVTLVRLDPLRVRADIPEASAAAVRVGQVTSFTVDAFPGRSFAARVARIGPSLSEQTRALTIEAELSNPGGQLRRECLRVLRWWLTPMLNRSSCPRRRFSTSPGSPRYLSSRTVRQANGRQDRR
jgi:multidrug efflux pump subunit AcrA (membrane-fusion protein)